jgi:CheY-like chemotaxis protein
MSAGADLRFDGLKALVVEDETIVSFLLEDMLSELGFSAVWHATDVERALAILRENLPDVAVLDVNLDGQMVYPIAQNLERAGVPFVFASGYGENSISSRWSRQPVLQKPFSLDSFASALNSALAQRA